MPLCPQYTNTPVPESTWYNTTDFTLDSLDANNQSTTFYQDPTATNPDTGSAYGAPTAQNIGDIWYDTQVLSGTSTPGNIMYRWDGNNWDNVQDGTIYQALTAATTAQSTATSASSTASSAYSLASSASSTASTAYSTATTAQSTANGKNTIYRSGSAPSGGSYVSGDMWFNTSSDNAISTWNGSSWVANALGNGALGTNISGSKISTGTIDASVVNVSNINAGNIVTGTLSSIDVTVGTSGTSNFIHTSYPRNTPTLGTSVTGFGVNGIAMVSASTAGCYSNWYPYFDSDSNLGLSTTRWLRVYATNSSISTSDQRLKNNIAESDLGLDFINAITPSKFTKIYNIPVPKFDANGEPEIDANGDRIIDHIKTTQGERYHYGFIAQDVKAQLDKFGVGDKFAGWTLDDPNDPNSRQGMAYEEMIAPMAKAIQELSAKVAALEAKLTPPATPAA